MRLISGVLVGIVLAGSTTYVAHADGIDDPSAQVGSVQPVQAADVGTATVPPAGDDAPADVVAELAPRRTEDFGLVGVTWQRGFDAAGMDVRVRLRTAGTWGAWEELHIESDEGEGGRDGTEPLWVGDADGVAVTVTSPTGRRPAGLAVSTIDPGTTSAPPASTVAAEDDPGTVTPVADGTPTYTARPKIISRASWGARKNTRCDSPRVSEETRGVVVHHTAGTNGYSRSQSAAIVRAVQAYHMKGRDWCDIGYNFLVDKYGQIFEGRNGGVDKPVRGAHAGDKGVNMYTMGVSMMGTFSSSRPTVATQAAMVKLIGWRLGTTFHAATGSYRVGKHRLQRIAGHRNVVSTACPGAAAYAWLSAEGGLRDRVADYIAGYSSDIQTLYRKLGQDATGPVRVGEYPFSNGPGGRKARMVKRDLYSTPTGAFSVSDHFRTEYGVVGQQAGALGVPIGSTSATSRPSVRVQRFANGSIYRVKRTKTRGYAVWGALDARYRQLGQEKSALGAPIRRQVKISGGRYRAKFAHGHMTWQRNGSVTVTIS